MLSQADSTMYVPASHYPSTSMLQLHIRLPETDFYDRSNAIERAAIERVSNRLDFSLVLFSEVHGRVAASSYKQPIDNVGFLAMITGLCLRSQSIEA